MLPDKWRLCSHFVSVPTLSISKHETPAFRAILLSLIFPSTAITFLFHYSSAYFYRSVDSEVLAQMLQSDTPPAKLRAVVMKSARNALPLSVLECSNVAGVLRLRSWHPFLWSLPSMKPRAFKYYFPLCTRCCTTMLCILCHQLGCVFCWQGQPTPFLRLSAAIKFLLFCETLLADGRVRGPIFPFFLKMLCISLTLPLSGRVYLHQPHYCWLAPVCPSIFLIDMRLHKNTFISL